MTEQQYIRITNRVHISIALHSLKNVLTNESSYGLSQEDLKLIISKLKDAETILFKAIDEGIE